MAIRDYIVSSIQLLQLCFHYACYLSFFVVYQFLCIIELACWSIDMRIEHMLTMNTDELSSPIPNHIKFINWLLRYVWRNTMRTIVYIHVSHQYLCPSLNHVLPNEATALIYYFMDHPAGPCTDYNIN